MIVENTIIYNTVVAYPLENNTGKNFSVPFPVDFEMSSLLVYIDEQLTETGWTFDSESSVVTFTEAPTGDSLIIRRKTKTDALIVTFSPGSILSDKEQNRNSKQMICAIQEIEDLYALYKDELIGYNTLFRWYYDSVKAAETVALQQAQAAVRAKVAAEAAQAAAQAAAEAAVGTLDNSLIPAHNSSPSAHPAIQNKFANYLPLAGGTMTGIIGRSGVLASNVTDGGSISLRGGTASHTNGGSLVLYDKGHPDRNGYFLLQASNATDIKNFYGTPDGRLMWGNYNVLRDYFNRADTVGTIQLFSGPDYLRGGYLRLHGLTNAESHGGFHLGTGNGTTNHELKGTPDGQLTWDGKTILNDMAHSTTANGYVKLTNGLIIQWGRGNSVNGETSVETQFPITFPTACLRVIASPFCSTANAGVDGWVQVMSYNTSKFKYFGQFNGDTAGIACDYIAIGY